MNTIPVSVRWALAVLSFAFAAPAIAVDFKLGEIDGSFSSDLSIGASWRVEDIDPTLVTPGNFSGGLASSNTADDGNLNFKDGDIYSLIFKGVHELELSRNNWGVLLRGKWWYDEELENGKRPHGNLLNGYTPNEKLDDSGFNDFAKASGIELLDAFLYGNFTLGERVPVDLRIGRQVVSWGESTFIQNGVNVINPVDVSAFRRPGAEIKEGLLPVNMFYVGAGITDALSVEAFYQLEWEKSVIDGCGTYFSQIDPAAGGCNGVTLATQARVDIPDGMGGTLPPIFVPISDQANIANGLFITRTPDLEPDDEGQFGLALRIFAEGLNFSEFGLYYLNIHSRAPYFAGVRGNNTPKPDGTFFLPDGRPDSLVFIPGDPFCNTPLQECNPKYTIVYPEDIEVWGATFATNLGGYAVSGEVSYRPDFPVGINTVELLQGAVAEAPWSTVTPRVKATTPGERALGYDDFDVLQWQFTVLKFYEQVLGASRLSLIAEVGGNRVSSLPPQSSQRYGRSSNYGVGAFTPIPLSALLLPFPGVVACDEYFIPPKTLKDIGVPDLVPNPNPANCTNDGYVTDTSWGYRIRGSLTYNDAFAGVNLTPSFAWSHDVDGYSPNTNFNEGAKALSLGLGAEYLNRYTANLSYTVFSGGDYNTQKDRDFVSLSFGVSF